MNSNALILDNSRFIMWLKNIYRKIINYSGTSTIVNLMRTVKKKIYFLPVKTVNIILVLLVLVSLIFNEETGLSTIMIKILFLLIALAGLFCRVDWQAVKKESRVLKYLNKILAKQ